MKAVDELISGARIEVCRTKQDPRDFAVWRAENIFPHNESEMIKCEAPMGKSLGNYVMIKDGLRQHSPMAIRFFVLSGHYRSNTDFSDAALHAAGKGYSRLIRAVEDIKLLLARAGAGTERDTGHTGIDTLELYEQRFLEVMDDDLNTPQAIASLFDLSRELKNRFDGGQRLPTSVLVKMLHFFSKYGGNILGIIPQELIKEEDHQEDRMAEKKLLSLVLEVRNTARKRKDWLIADMIREELSKIVL